MKWFLTLLLMTAPLTLHAQQSLTQLQSTKPTKFWTLNNTLCVAGITAATSADAYYTDRGFETYHPWHEHNPLIPTARSGRVAYFAGTYSASILGAWILQRSGHPRAASWMLRIHLGIETQAAVYTGTH